MNLEVWRGKLCIVQKMNIIYIYIYIYIYNILWRFFFNFLIFFGCRNDCWATIWMNSYLVTISSTLSMSRLSKCVAVQMDDFVATSLRPNQRL